MKQFGGLFGAIGLEIVKKKMLASLSAISKAHPACTEHALGASSEDAFSTRTK
jgi:hypothetical protein